MHPSMPETRELTSVAVPATSQGASTVPIDYKTSKNGRSIVGVEVINGHNFAIVVEADRWSERILAKQTRFLDVPKKDHIRIRAAGGAIQDDTVLLKPTIELGAHEAARKLAKERRAQIGEAIFGGGL